MVWVSYPNPIIFGCDMFSAIFFWMCLSDSFKFPLLNLRPNGGGGSFSFYYLSFYRMKMNFLESKQI